MAEEQKYSVLFGADSPPPSDHVEQRFENERRDDQAGVSKPPSETQKQGGIGRRRHEAIIPGYEDERIKERKILTLRDLLYIFFKHLRSITVITAVCFVTALAYSFMVTPLYKAETKILVRMGREKLSDLNEYSRNVNILYQKRNQDVNNELEIFKSDKLSRMVYEELKDYFDPVAVESEKSSIRLWLSSLKARVTGNPISQKDQIILFLEHSLKVEFLAETDILRLSFSSADPVFSATAANTYADSFMKLRTKIYEIKKSHEFYVNQIAVYKQKVSALVGREKAFSEKWHISQVEKEKELILQNKENLGSDLVKARQEMARTVTLLDGLKKMFEDKNSWIETPKMSENEMVDRQAYLQDVDRQYFTLKLERARLMGKFTEKSREIKQLDNNIAKLRKQKYLSLVNILALTSRTRKSLVEGLEAELARKNKRLDELIRAGYVMEQMKVDKNVALESFLNYTKKAESLRIYDDLDKSRITSLRTINVATPPLQPFFPKKGLILLTATFFGIFLSFGLSAIKEFFTHVFRDGHDIEGILKVPLLMSIGHREHG